MGRHEVFAEVQHELDALRLLKDHLKALGLLDDENLASVVESETNLKELFETLLDQLAEIDADVAKMDQRIGDLQGRKKSYQNAKESLRNIIEVAMTQAGLPTMKTAFGTLSVKSVPGKPEIVAEEDIPLAYWVRPEPVLDLAKIGADLRAREKAIKEANAMDDEVQRMKRLVEIDVEMPAIPGVVLGNEKVTLAIRKK